MLLEREGGNLAVTGVALVIAVGESRCKFSQVALSNCLTAQRTERLRAGCPAIHQHEFYMLLVHRAALGVSSFSRAPGAAEINCMTCSTFSCTP